MSDTVDTNFFFEAVYSKRMFKGQSSGPKIGSQMICENTKDNVLCKIFEFCKIHMMREIIIEEKDGKRVAEWSLTESPSMDDVQKYILFQNKLTKRTYKWNDVSEVLLNTWRSKEIGVLIHVHSLSLDCSNDFEIVKSSLLMPGERDRAGAHTTEAIIELTSKLQEIHPYLDADPISWKIWAHSILVSHASERDSLINRMPGGHIGQNFTFKSPEARQLNATGQQLLAARNLNVGYLRDIQQLRDTFDNLMEAVNMLKTRIEALENRQSMENGLISAFEQAMVVEETEFSQQLVENVTDQADIDHD